MKCVIDCLVGLSYLVRQFRAYAMYCGSLPYLLQIPYFNFHRILEQYWYKKNSVLVLVQAKLVILSSPSHFFLAIEKG